MDIVELKNISEETFKRHPWELARAEALASLIRPYVISNSDDKIVILDVGCGDGFIAQSLSECFSQIRVIGFDPALDLATIKRIKRGVKTDTFDIFSSLDKIPYDKIKVDIVLFLDVLEHVSDDISLLNIVMNHSLIKKNAIVFIMVPAFQSLFSTHDLFLRHYRRYNRKQLLRVASRIHLQKIRSGYFFTSLLLLRLLTLIFERACGHGKASGSGILMWRGGREITFLIKRLLLYDFNISLLFQRYHINIPGLSCYLIGQR